MKQMSRMFLLLSITVLVSGCKLAVIVVEGGEVQSTGSGTCAAGTICIVDVTDPNFSETFTAVPDEGWYFQKWNSGYGFFCGASTDPTCTLSFQGYEESEGVEKMVASSEIFYLMPVFKSPRIASVEDKVTVDGRLWLQPKDFINYSYDQVSAVCPGGVCTGSLPGSTFDLTGFTWASIDDANALFAAYREEGRSILEDFVYIATDRDSHILAAMLSDPPYEDRQVYIALILAGGPPYDPTEQAAVIEPSFSIQPSDSESNIGVWFWK